MTAKNYVGKTCQHKQLGEVLVKAAPKRSRKTVMVEVTGKGQGWDESSQRYKGVRSTIKNQAGEVAASNWSRQENRNFGAEHEVSIDQLTLTQN